ncbi:MAG: PAS domain S-box protein, partial [Flavobacteriales bacterium]|nr:PAS domain S-box protein [Flavobacteriales bacterium]
MNPRSKNTIEDSEAALKNIFMQVPAMIAILKGHEYVFDFANPAYMEMVDNLNLTGKTLLEARPELEGQGFIELLDNVYKTGETFFGKEMPMMFNRNGKHEQAYVNFSYQAFKNTKGETEGILVFANEVTEHVKARKQIEESEKEHQKMAARLKLATDSANIGTWSLDIKTQKLEWSALHKIMWGYDEHAKGLTYEDWHKVIVQEDKEKAFKKIEEARVNQTAYEAEYAIHRANDGALRWIRSFGKYYYNDKGEAKILTGISIDITEQKEAEKKITESEERFRILADNIPNLSWMADADGNIFWYNQKWYDYTGTTLADMEGWGWQSVHDPKELPNVLVKWREAIKTGNPFEMSIPLKGADGKFRQFLTRVLPLYNSQNKIYRWLGTNTDVNKQKEAEEKIKESEKEHQKMAARLQFSIQAAKLGTWEIDVETEESVRDFRHDEIFGYSEPVKEWNFEKFFKHIHPEDLKYVKDIIKDAQYHKSFECETRIITPGGQIIWIEIKGKPMPDFKGKKKLFGVVADITEKKTLELQKEGYLVMLKEYNKELEELTQAKDNFISLISHDLRNPLSVIVSSSDILLQNIENKDIKDIEEFGRVINRSSKRVMAKFSKLVELSRSKNKASFNPVNKSLHECVNISIQMIESFAAHKNITINNETPLDIEIFADSLMMESILQNLISNAIKFTPDGGYVSIKGKVKEGEEGLIEIRVKDSGIGMTEEIRKSIFDERKTITTKGTKEEEGSGLGLKLVKEFVRKQGGTIWVESEPGEGSCFAFTVPQAKGN